MVKGRLRQIVQQLRARVLHRPGPPPLPAAAGVRKPRLQQTLRWVGASLALLVVLAMLAAGGGYAWLRATVPAPSGAKRSGAIAATSASAR